MTATKELYFARRAEGRMCCAVDGPDFCPERATVLLSFWDGHPATPYCTTHAKDRASNVARFGGSYHTEPIPE